MIAHTMLAVADSERAKSFYSRVLAPLGYAQAMDFGDSAGFNDGNNIDFWIAEQDAVQTTHLAFAARSREEVEAFYRAALAAGAKDNGAPGYRPEYWSGYYAAFVYDPDGHNIEAVWFDYDKAE